MLHRRRLAVNHGCYAFRVHQRRATFSDPVFLWSECVSGTAIHQRFSAQYGNSVLPQRSVYKWIEKLKKMIAQLLRMTKERDDLYRHH